MRHNWSPEGLTCEICKFERGGTEVRRVQAPVSVSREKALAPRSVALRLARLALGTVKFPPLGTYLFRTTPLIRIVMHGSDAYECVQVR
jgi:hypothetical protein